MKKIRWDDDPEPQNYPAAQSYLGLIYEEKTVKNIIAKLREVPTQMFKSKDIFRASRLSLLGNNNSHMKSNKKKIQEGKKLSPILLVRDTKNGKVVIADGYHRLCAVYAHDEDAEIPCRITDEKPIEKENYD